MMFDLHAAQDLTGFIQGQQEAMPIETKGVQPAGPDHRPNLALSLRPCRFDPVDWALSWPFHAQPYRARRADLRDEDRTSIPDTSIMI